MVRYCAMWSVMYNGSFRQLYSWLMVQIIFFRCNKILNIFKEQKIAFKCSVKHKSIQYRLGNTKNIWQLNFFHDLNTLTKIKHGNLATCLTFDCTGHCKTFFTKIPQYMDFQTYSTTSSFNFWNFLIFQWPPSLWYSSTKKNLDTHTWIHVS